MKSENKTPDYPIGLVSTLMLPDLQQLNSTELMDLFIQVGKKFDQGLNHQMGLKELNDLQLQIARIKDELYKKANLSPESSLQNNFFFLSLHGRS